jgi:hypothetical protein
MALGSVLGLGLGLLGLRFPGLGSLGLGFLGSGKLGLGLRLGTFLVEHNGLRMSTTGVSSH